MQGVLILQGKGQVCYPGLVISLQLLQGLLWVIMTSQGMSQLLSMRVNTRVKFLRTALGDTPRERRATPRTHCHSQPHHTRTALTNHYLPHRETEGAGPNKPRAPAEKSKRHAGTRTQGRHTHNTHTRETHTHTHKNVQTQTHNRVAARIAAKTKSIRR